MPAQAYYLLAERRFPDRDEFEAAEPGSLLTDEEENVEEVSSRVERYREQTVEGCTIYQAEHDYRKELRFVGRARGQRFREYVQIRNFPVFRYHEAPHPDLFKPVVIRTNKQVAFDFVERMNMYVDDFDLKRTEVDMDCLKNQLRELSGAWFSDMQSPNLASTAVFGPHVELSNEFQHAEQHGELSNITFPFELNGDPHKIMVTRQGAVVTYENFALDAEVLELVMAALTRLLRNCIRIVGH